MTELQSDPGFAPADPTDERKLGEWETRYSDPRARRHIYLEASYLAVHLFGVLLALFLWSYSYGLKPISSTAEITTNADFGWVQLLYAWLGGVLGGTLFSIKWLIHVVAKNLWNMDRKLWRLFTPHVSGALAVAFVALMASGIVVIIDENTLWSIWVCFGLGFLLGYFSDNAIAKLSEIARTLFGAMRQDKCIDGQTSDGTG